VEEFLPVIMTLEGRNQMNDKTGRSGHAR